MSTSKVMLGMVIGMAAGAVLGILTAPDSGINTRKKISTKGQGYVDDLKYRVNGFKEGFRDRVDTVKNEAHNLLDQASSKLDHAASKLETTSKKTSNYGS
jgi:gas vesicle protein